MTNPVNIKNKAINSFKWSILGEISSKFVGPLVLIVLAKLLVPEDFGVVAVATILISFSKVIWDAGLMKALIQRKDKITESATVVFWINFVISLVVFVLLIFTADSIAHFFGDDRISGVLQILSIQIPLASIVSVQTALLQRDFEFKKLSLVRFLTVSIPGLASIPLALYGAGYWSLIIGALVGQIAQTIVLWRMSAWRPKCTFDMDLAVELFDFGRWVMLSSLLMWVYAWLDTIIVGHYLGSHDMGLYRTGNAFALMLFGMLFSPLLPVLYSLFSRAQDDLKKIKNTLIIVSRSITLFSLPMAFGLFALSKPIEKIIFGDEWAGIGLVLGFLALMHGFSWVIGANGEVYRAIGKPKLELITAAFMLSIYVVVYLYSIQYGMIVFVMSRFGLSLVSLLLHVFVSWKYLSIEPIQWVKIMANPLLASILMYFLLVQIEDASGSYELGGLIGSIIIGAISYVIIIYMLDKEFLKEIKTMLVDRKVVV